MPNQNQNTKSRIVNGYVPWVIFVFIISVSVFLFNNMNAQVKTNTDDITNVKVFMGATNETLKNIDKSITEIKEILRGKK